MATFTLTKTLNANDLRQAITVAEQLRRAADAVENQTTILSSYTKTDNYGTTQYAWSVA